MAALTSQALLATNPAAQGGPPRDSRRDPDPTAEEVRGDALVVAFLARQLRIGDATVARAWREYGVQP
jgi:hypothetical protein